MRQHRSTAGKQQPHVTAFRLVHTRTEADRDAQRRRPVRRVSGAPTERAELSGSFGSCGSCGSCSGPA